MSGEVSANYPSKKAIKDSTGTKFSYIETGFFGPVFNPNGDTLFVGPNAWNNRKFYGTVTCKDGKIVKVK